MQSSHLSKPAMRQAMKKELANLGEETRRQLSHGLCESILTSSLWRAANVVMVFSPLPDEPDIRRLHPPNSSKQYVYPRVFGQTIALHRIDDPARLVPGCWGILEPRDDPSTLTTPDTVDLVLVPGLAFSRRLERLGRGAGFYDRFLSQLRPDAMKAGICFDLQLVDSLPCEPHDIPMDGILTESGLLAR